MSTRGIHHITAIAIDPQANIDFYTRILGLRLVKKTVNYDAPDVYHFYFGDHVGTPGTVLTFFPFTDADRGAPGPGQPTAVRFAIAKSQLEPMMLHLAENGIDCKGATERYGDEVLAFKDPEGMQLEIVGRDGVPEAPALGVHGFDSVDLLVAAPARTISLLTDTFGFVQSGEAEGRKRFSVGGPDQPGRSVDVVDGAARGPGRQGGGSIHHVAFRAADDAELQAWRRELVGLGLDVTEIRERNYFRSIYFREPGGILFEIATDRPGFTLDEPVERLGTTLKLPPWLESKRADIERRLPPLRD